MESKEKGCVYFFKHIGLSPVKIGYSENQSPIFRFEQFKTFAPFGAELLGFIMTENSKGLETLLHQKFASKRLKGEWFEITDEDVKKCISFYSNIEDIEEKNSFEIEWAKRKNKSINIFEDYLVSSFLKNYDIEKNDKNFKVILNNTDIIQDIGINKSDLKYVLEKLKLKYKVHNILGKYKKGYLLYKKIP